MKVKLCIFSLLLLLFSVKAAYAENVNLVKNPGFEDSTSQNLSYWDSHAWDNKPGTVDFIFDDKEAHSGRKSALIINNMPTDARLKQEIKVKSNSYYKLSCWIKAENVGAEAKGANISVDGILESSKDVRNTGGWEHVELYGKTSKDQKSLILTIGLGGYGSLNSGKAWFDDIAVEELAKVPAGKHVVNLYPTSKQSSEEKENKGFSPAVWALLTITFLSVLAGLAFVFNNTQKVNSNKFGWNISNSRTVESAANLKIDKNDIIIMSIMTFTYLVVALFNLGSTKVPQTSWQPAKSGEGFIVDFGKEVSIERIYYYSGLDDGKFRVEHLNKTGKFSPIITEEKKSIFTWKHIDTPVNTSKLRFTFETARLTLNEIVFVEQGKKEPIKDFTVIEELSDRSDTGNISNLFDEQHYFSYRPSYMTSMYFDEIYHARTAYEHIHHIHPYEWTHPPLGKLLISLGILIFGMNPFGWRIMGTLFGAGMIPIMYLFGKKLFEKRFYAFCSAFLIMFDFMHFTQTRIATIDVYGTFFIIIMYYYMYDYFVRKSYTLEFRQSLKPLFLSGLFFGIGVASKWIAAYGGAGLAVLFFMAKILESIDYSRIKNSKSTDKPAWVEKFIPQYMVATMLCCVLFFVIIPAIIYYASYTPYMAVPGAKSGINLVLDYQSQMYNYHSKLVATHPFSSPWYEWPVIYKPTWFYSGTDMPNGSVSTIVAMGNPAIWWIGIAAIIMAVIISISKREKKMIVVFVAITFQYLPWVLVGRITWIYHFFSTVPFMILSIVYVIKNIIEVYNNSKIFIYIYLGVVAILFIWFYPALSGFEVSKPYIESLKWFNSWIF